MAIKLNGTTGIDLGGSSINNTASVNNIVVPNEVGEFITSFREDNHIPLPASMHLLQGNVSVTGETSVAGFASTAYSGNSTLTFIPTGIDMDTQWGNDASKRYGGLSIIKAKTVAGWQVSDSVRGAGNWLDTSSTAAQLGGTGMTFNNNGITVTTGTNNATGVNYINYSFQTTHRRTGVTNHGQAIEEHYNPSTGFFILKWSGSGALGHLLTHSLGRKISFAMWKNIGSTDTWLSMGETLGLGNFFLTPGTAALNSTGPKITFGDKEINLQSLATDTNASGSTYIMYGWADAIVDDSNKLIGNFETGIYILEMQMQLIILLKRKLNQL